VNRTESKGSVSAKSKAKIVRTILEKFRRDPDFIASFFPDLYKELCGPKPKRSRLVPEAYQSGHGELTELERRTREAKLRKIVEKFKTGATLSKDEGLELLEHLASLSLKHVQEYSVALKAVEQALSINLDEERDQTRLFRKGRTGKIQCLLTGIELYLTWDGKLLKIKWHKGDIIRRNKALSFVGRGADSQSDVAGRHDEYLANALL